MVVCAQQANNRHEWEIAQATPPQHQDLTLKVFETMPSNVRTGVEKTAVRNNLIGGVDKHSHVLVGC